MLHLRRTCSRCGRRRKVNAWWPRSGKRLCKECSLAPDVAFCYSVYNITVGIPVGALVGEPAS